MSDIMTECCEASILGDQRYCPKCGWECRIKPTAESSAAAILLELVAVEELGRKLSAGHFFNGRDPYQSVAQAREEYFRRYEAAWAAAREWRKQNGA